MQGSGLHWACIFHAVSSVFWWNMDPVLTGGYMVGGGGVPRGQKSQAGSPLLFYNDGLCVLDTHTAFPNGPQLGPTRAKLEPI